MSVVHFISMPQRCSPDRPVAILTFQSHRDRSFLDDRELALLSGDLRDHGVANDLVLTGLGGTPEHDQATEARLADLLAAYDPIVYERVWDPDVIHRLRRALPGRVFIGLRGEHLLLDAAPADFFCDDPKRALVSFLQWLRGTRLNPPAGIKARAAAVHGLQGWVDIEDAEDVAPSSSAFAPNLRPLIVNPEDLPESRTFSILGNAGCPYQADARLNPLYAGAKIPAQFGRGCAFCTTGNHYDARPNDETAQSVFTQIRYVRQQAPELDRLVLKDQNPFGYLTEVVQRCEAEQVTEFTLLLETRAEWFLRNAGRFATALESAGRGGVRIAPYLVGIENFSQAELDRFNKGIRAETNIEFLETLWAWKDRYGDALDLSHAAFGFILFSPWTTLADLRINLDAIRRTRFDRLRGSVLLSRARLYPDTALYYLAERDGLLAEEFESAGADASRRYGYYPSRPWRHVHADVAHFARLATKLCERNANRDVVGLFDALLTGFAAAGARWSEVTVESVWARYQDGAGATDMLPPASSELRQRLATLLRPWSLEGEFEAGWRITDVRARRGLVELELRHANEEPVVLRLSPRSDAAAFGRTSHYDIRVLGRQLTRSQETAARLISSTLARNDS